MMHFEVLVNDLDAAVRSVVGWGGSEARINQWTAIDAARIMLDPAGHPFCLFVDGE